MYMMAGSRSYEATVGEHNSLKNIKRPAAKEKEWLYKERWSK